mgnify:CR=1 FL=1
MRIRAALLLSIIFVLLSWTARAEVCWGTLPLSTAAPEKSAEILANITNVTTLNSQEDLKMGKIIDVDAVDTTLLIAVKYNDAMQVWIWDVYDGFQYGYEIKSTYILSKASYALSADHIVLIVLGKYMPTLAIEGTDDETTLTVYDTPKEVKEYRYKYPSFSDYRYVTCSKGRVIVEAPDGTQITIFDRTSEYQEYADQEELGKRPFAIWQLIIFLICMALLIWVLDKSIESAPPSIEKR